MPEVWSELRLKFGPREESKKKKKNVGPNILSMVGSEKYIFISFPRALVRNECNSLGMSIIVLSAPITITSPRRENDM